MNATLNVTLNGQNGTLPDPIPFDMSDEDIRAVVRETLTTGGIPGIDQVEDNTLDLTDFVIERFAPTNEIPAARCFFRPKTPFGR